MTMKHHQDVWPLLPYDEFCSTKYLLHMGVQVIGKFKLATPFEPHWANVALWLTGQGVTSGPIPFGSGVFSIDIDFISHQVICTASWGGVSKFGLVPMSVAQFTNKLFDALRSIGVHVSINLMPQEVPDPIPFDKDTQHRHYNRELANAWFRILISTYRVLQRYHARFTGKTPYIGLMWGTFDLRDARYLGKRVSTEGPNSGYIRRNAMDVIQVEAGWWCGDERYPHAAYFSFLYPEPKGMSDARIQPKKARWVKSLGEFILDYDDVRLSKDPEGDLLAFFESTYECEAAKAGWDPELLGTGKPS
jgi:hypothetical protein